MMAILRKVYFFLLDALQTLLIAAAVFLVVYMFLFRPFQVKGDSMYPNFQDKEYVLTNLIGLKFQKLKTGDVIIFKAPPDPDKDFIKRVLGAPGNRVLIKDGDVYLNGQLLDESAYLAGGLRTSGGSFLQEGQEVTVGPNEYFVMGDNRNESSDSREWGFVPRDKIIGLSFLIYWPVSKLQVVSNPY
jgi:signal peptidase I